LDGKTKTSEQTKKKKKNPGSTKKKRPKVTKAGGGGLTEGGASARPTTWRSGKTERGGKSPPKGPLRGHALGGIDWNLGTSPSFVREPDGDPWNPANL